LRLAQNKQQILLSQQREASKRFTKPCLYYHNKTGCSYGQYCDYYHNPQYKGMKVPGQETLVKEFYEISHYSDQNLQNLILLKKHNQL